MQKVLNHVGQEVKSFSFFSNFKRQNTVMFDCKNLGVLKVGKKVQRYMI